MIDVALEEMKLHVVGTVFVKLGLVDDLADFDDSVFGAGASVDVVHHESQELVLGDWGYKRFLEHFFEYLLLFVLFLAVGGYEFKNFGGFVFKSWRNQQLKCFTAYQLSEVF